MPPTTRANPSDPPPLGPTRRYGEWLGLRDDRRIRGRNYAAERVAAWIAQAARAEEDPRTLHLCCRAAAVSVRTLQYACSAAHVSPIACRDFARLLRLVLLTLDGHHPWNPGANLDADPRTVRRLLRLSDPDGIERPTAVEHFIERQSFVQTPAVLAALSSLLLVRDSRPHLQSPARRHRNGTHP